MLANRRLFEPPLGKSLSIGVTERQVTRAGKKTGENREQMEHPKFFEGIGEHPVRPALPVPIHPKLKKSLPRLSIFPLRDDYRMKMQCAKQCCLPEDH
jgi:hypothetical protein